MTTREKPYTLPQLIGTLASLAVESALMIAGTTWLALHDKAMGRGVAYTFAILITLACVMCSGMQVHLYQQDRDRK